MPSTRREINDSRALRSRSGSSPLVMISRSTSRRTASALIPSINSPKYGFVAEGINRPDGDFGFWPGGCA